MLTGFSINNFKGLTSVHVQELERVNAFIGKNNSGKSSILHAIDIAGLATTIGNWSYFQPKIEIKDLFSAAGSFSVELFDNIGSIKVSHNQNHSPQMLRNPQDNRSYKTILVMPDAVTGLIRRQHRTPKQVIDHISQGNFADFNALDILYSIKHYALRNERGFKPSDYHSILAEISNYFPDISNMDSDRTDSDISTLKYDEYGNRLDIIYSGSGLRHFLDILIKTTVSKAKIVLLDEPEQGLHPDLQRRFFDFISDFAATKDVQVIMATHSQVLLNYCDKAKVYRVVNKLGNRQVTSVPNDAMHTVLSDLGIRPSDLFNQDICLMVEGASEVVFFDHVIRELYKKEFEKVSVGVVQYGGGAAEAIGNGSIRVDNITPAQKYVFWLHDRDAPLGAIPSTQTTKFINSLKKANQECRILDVREIEYYYPETVHLAAQQGDAAKETATQAIYSSNQSEKYRTAAEKHGVCVPKGVYLRKLLKQHLTDKSQLPQEIREIVEKTLMKWRDEILG